MKSVLMLALMASLPAFSTAAHAVVTPDRIYEFDGNGTDLLGGPDMVAGSNATYVQLGQPAGGMRFAANQGPTVSGALARGDVYSIEMFFSLDNLRSYRRLIDFKGGAVEAGLYMRNSALAFYGPDTFDSETFAPGDMIHVVLSRDASGTVRGFANGTERWSFLDTENFAVFDRQDELARFFRDDGTEAASGFVDFIRLYDRVLTGDEVHSLYNDGMPLRSFEAAAVPEPASWALMIGGMGAAGALMRRRARPALA